jgi:NAD(P)-dependent dehydrogenase (short-subunit alcohol dehydrogenase family)
MNLDGKVAIVTGAAQGIGAGISRVLAYQGAKVCLTDVQEAVNKTAGEIGGRAYIMDVTSQDSVDSAIKRIESEYSHIDILVNNAGIYPRRKLVEMDDAFLRRLFEVNVFGMFRCARAVLPGMMARRYGKIVNMSSVTGPMVGTPAGGQTAYGSSKAAVIGFTKALALEVAQYGLNVNCILPGYVYSPSAFGIRGGGSGDAEAAMREFGRKIPMCRQGTPEDIGKLVAFLASDESGYLTGSEVVIDGGNILQEEYLGPYNPR